MYEALNGRKLQMAEKVKIRHSELKASDEADSGPAETTVSRDAFDLVWSKKGWALVEDAETTNAATSVTSPSSPAPSSTRKVTDSPQA